MQNKTKLKQSADTKITIACKMRKEAEEQQIPTNSRNTASNCQQMLKEA